MKLVAALLFASALSAQAPSTPAYPDSWVGLGSAYNGVGSPHVTGLGTYARLVSKGAGLYSFTTYEVSVNSNRQIASSTRTGFGLVVRQIALGPSRLSIVGLGDVGVAISASQAPSSGSTAAAAYSAGGGVVWQYSPASQWNVSAWYRKLTATGQPENVYELMIGYAPK